VNSAVLKHRFNLLAALNAWPDFGQDVVLFPVRHLTASAHAEWLALVEEVAAAGNDLFLEVISAAGTGEKDRRFRT
jgi:hypothetical protein